MQYFHHLSMAVLSISNAEILMSLFIGAECYDVSGRIADRYISVIAK